MPDLEMLLREVRPAPDPVWAEKLDAKVAARFPGPVPGYKKKLRTLREHFAALSLATATVATLVLIVVVIGKNIDTGGSDDSGSSASIEVPTSAKSAGGSASDSAQKSASGETAAAATPSADSGSSSA